MHDLTKTTFAPPLGLFAATPQELLTPDVASRSKLAEGFGGPAAAFARRLADDKAQAAMNGLPADDDAAGPPPPPGDHLRHFEFAGRVLGKALYEGILVEPLFANCFLNKLLGRHNGIDDLYTLDPELYRHLMSLKTFRGAGHDGAAASSAAHGGATLADLCLTFAAPGVDGAGRATAVDLVPHGRNADVDPSNVVRYIHLMAHYKLNVETAAQCRAFLGGFHDLIPVKWVRMFGPQELQRLIGGDEQRPDLDDLLRHTNYAGGLHPSQPIVAWFWDALRSFTTEQLGLFLRFVTSCSRPPLLGFGALYPKICVQGIPAGDSGGKLPSASTCMNLLKLPVYTDKETLRQKLLLSVTEAKGFELS